MGIRDRIAYRGWQFWKLITSRSLTEEEARQIADILSVDQMALFSRQNAAGQQHGFRVFQRLIEDGINNQDLLVAALLHDVGKIRYKSYWWDRPLVVVMGVLFPTRIKAWGKNNRKGWRRPFVIKEQHALWGAEYVQQAGCSPITVDLILHHQDEVRSGHDTVETTLLDQLLRADNKS